MGENNKSSNQIKKEESSKDSGRAAPRRAKSSMQSDTVMTQFKTQLTSLMKGLNETQSRYIRCVKPNTLKKKLVLQHVTTLDQLRCAGVVAAVTISRSAYPSKLEYGDVLHRYAMLNENKPKEGYSTEAAEIEDLLDKTLVSFEKKKKDGSISKAYAVGKTKIYFKSGCLEYLEAQRGKVWPKWMVKIQAPVRGFLTRRRIEREKESERQRIAAEQERIRAEKEAEERRIRAEQEAEQERIRAEEERIRAEKEAEEERIRAEQDAEQERIRAEQERIRAEKEAEERRERERIMKEKLAAQKK